MPFNRRNFIKSATAVAAFQVVPSRVLGLNGQTPPSEELIRGIIGCGGMGSNHIAYRGSRILALCDVDSNRLSGGVRRAAGQGHKDVTAYHDFRDMIARPDIDIISIATPPHWHGLQAILAAEAGKDVWCEKPMTRTIGEGQRLVDACKRNGSILRINTWFRMIDNFYGMGIPVSTVKTAINSGLLGGPLTVTVGGGQGFGWKHNWSGKTDLKAETIPDYLDYDRWLGPAPWKEYARHRTHGSFRGYWDYDGGGLGDMGMHYLDPVQYLIGKDNTSPVKIEVDTDDQHHDAVGVWRRVILTYADGCRIILDGNNSLRKNPFIAGPDGNIFRGFKSDIKDFAQKLKDFPAAEELNSDFHVNVRSRKKFALNEVNGHRSCTLVNLSKIVLRLNRMINFDPDKQVFIKDEGANRLINQPMRAPWNLI